MKKLQLMITPDLMSQLGLADTADDNALLMAIKTNAENAAKVPKLQSRIQELETQNTTLKEDKEKVEQAASEKEITNALAGALKEGRTTVELNNQLKDDYKGRPEALNKVLASMKPFKSITENLNNSVDAKSYEGKSFDDLYESGELETVKNKLPELYAKLYKDAHGKEPKEK